MILSASRRTDIPTYYSEWFFNRIHDGYALVRNPMNYHQLSKIKITPDVVDGIVFWTKNPIPMLPRLRELSEYTYYFQFTLNSYADDIEPSIPLKSKYIIPAFQKLSDMIGPDRVIWRYDPILLNDKYSIGYHLKYFANLAKLLHPYTKKCTFSFIDFYRNTQNNVKGLELITMTEEHKLAIAKGLSEIAHSYGLSIDTCAEDIDLDQFGITHARCVDDRLLGKLLGRTLKVEKDKNQRLSCGCVASVDIGMYNTCRNGCKYCYANYSPKSVATNSHKHSPTSPVICGEITDEDTIIERPVKSCAIFCQQKIFEPEQQDK